jgi:hypothetical protein
MSYLEDLIYEAQELGVKDLLFEKYEEIKNLEELKYSSVQEKYEIAFNEVLHMVKK